HQGRRARLLRHRQGCRRADTYPSIWKGESVMDRPALAEFRREVNINIAFGDVELPVVSVDGAHPVIVALEDEPLFALLGRLKAIGGFANLFVRGAGRVW